MAVVTGNLLPVGMRYVSVFELNADGSPAATDTSAYEGLQIVGGQAFTLNLPDPRPITHVGDDGPLQIDYLPPTEGMSGELVAARMDMDIYALLTGTNVLTVGEAKSVGFSTDKQGSEPQVGLMMYQQALDDNGERVWRSFIFPRATVYPRPNGMNPNPSENRFVISPAVVTKHLWETAFASTAEGYIRSQGMEIHTKYKPKLISFLGDNSNTAFALPETGADTAKMVVWVDGVLQTTQVTKATTEVSFGAAPTTGARIVAFYEFN